MVPEFLCPSDQQRAVSVGFGPTNYAVCAGSGASGGSPLDADGLFYTNSAVRSRQVKDGHSRTAAVSESILGRERAADDRSCQTPIRASRMCSRVPPRSPKRLVRHRRFGTTRTYAGFAWVNGEFRSALYNHYLLPEFRDFDCVSALTSGPPAVIYSAFGWRSRPQSAYRWRQPCHARCVDSLHRRLDCTVRLVGHVDTFGT